MLVYLQFEINRFALIGLMNLMKKRVLIIANVSQSKVVKESILKATTDSFIAIRVNSSNAFSKVLFEEISFVLFAL